MRSIWPALRVQVLDDSTDDTRQPIDRLVADARARGHDIAVLRRPDRRGLQAGNLAHGLSQLGADCGFIAVFDADFVPPPDFLRRLMPILLADERLGFVQTRWGYLNEGQNLLTRVQALILDGLMLVEQAYLDAHALPLQWNGTSGIFRTAAIKSRRLAGRSPGATSVLTEDLDVATARCSPVIAAVMSRRSPCQRASRGHGGIPRAAAALGRWRAQVLRSLFGKLWHDGPRGRSLLTLLAHLARHARQPIWRCRSCGCPLLLLPPLWPGHGLVPTGELAAPLPSWCRRFRRSPAGSPPSLACAWRWRCFCSR